MLGDRLGKWVIFKELGRGGMGRVFLAQDEMTGQKAAIKVLAGELAQDVGFLQRFQREIETLSKLDHPHIVRFIESGIENGHYFYAMEFVEGQNLEQVLEEKKRIPWSEALDIALQVTPALKHIHDHGVIHRDLKPSNLLRATTGLVKLTDFGIAKVFAATHLTATGGIVGTAEYISPEQAAGKIVGRRSDIYSFGCVLYTLVTGRPPFTGLSYIDLIHKHRYGQFDRPGKIVDDLPAEFDELLCQMMAKDPEERPRDAMVLLKNLEAIQKKVHRKQQQTSADNQAKGTVAENRADKLSADQLAAAVGPATLMSRLMRSELDRMNRGGPVQRFLNQPIVLVTLLAACLGVLGWTFWPLSAHDYFANGEKLMASDEYVDWLRADRECFVPLDRKFPSHAYRDEVAKFRHKIEADAAPNLSEAQRFFQLGEQQKLQGNLAAAQQTWLNLVTLFQAADAEQLWVRRAESALIDLEKQSERRDRFKSAQAALDRAKSLREQGRRDEADKIARAVVELYRPDPAARDLVAEAEKLRK